MADGTGRAAGLALKASAASPQEPCNAGLRKRSAAGASVSGQERTALTDAIRGLRRRRVSNRDRCERVPSRHDQTPNRPAGGDLTML